MNIIKSHKSSKNWRNLFKRVPGILHVICYELVNLCLKNIFKIFNSQAFIQNYTAHFGVLVKINKAEFS